MTPLSTQYSNMMSPRSQPNNNTPTTGTRFAAIKANADVGTMGAMGAIGAVGAMGATGAIGAVGAIGATGAIGAVGAIGATGAIGAVGANRIAAVIVRTIRSPSGRGMALPNEVARPS